MKLDDRPRRWIIGLTIAGWILVALYYWQAQALGML